MAKDCATAGRAAKSARTSRYFTCKVIPGPTTKPRCSSISGARGTCLVKRCFPSYRVCCAVAGTHAAARMRHRHHVAAVSIVPSTHLLVVQGKCIPSIGSVYNVYVAEGCIPERDYISEMQDTSDRVSKQVKIYLRRCVCMLALALLPSGCQSRAAYLWARAGSAPSSGAHAQAPTRC